MTTSSAPLVGRVADDLQAHPVNYGHRRAHLDADWGIPDEDWQRLRTAMLTARVARTDTPWERRRSDLRIWLWSEVTSGDPALAPMIQTAGPTRRSTDGAVSSYTTLRNRAVPALERPVADYAATLVHQIDTAPPVVTARPTSTAGGLAVQSDTFLAL